MKELLLDGADAEYPATPNNPLYQKNELEILGCVDVDKDSRTFEDFVMVPEGTFLACLLKDEPNKTNMVPFRWKDGSAIYFPLHAVTYVSGDFCGPEKEDKRETY